MTRAVKYSFICSVLLTTALVLGGIALIDVYRTVYLSVDGAVRKVEVSGATVQAALDQTNTSIHDALVRPALPTPIEDGDTVTVQYEREVELVVDGSELEVETYGTTVGEVLDEAVPALPPTSDVNLPASLPVPREGLALPITVQTPKTVTVKKGDHVRTVTTTAGTVKEVMDELGVVLDSDDTVRPGLLASVRKGLQISYVVTDVTVKTVKEPIRYKTVKRKTDELVQGQRRVTSEGKPGVRLNRVQTVTKNGKIVRTKIVESKIKSKPVPRVVKIGTALAYPEVDPNSARGIAQTQMRAYGWGFKQFECLDLLWTRESGWNYRADNPNSSAYGIPQSLPGAKMASAGPDWRTNPATQIEWGLSYIAGRYGKPCNAWAHSEAVGWY